MSYRSFKRVLGETSLERKCRFLFGAIIFIFIFIAFYLVDGVAEDLLKQNTRDQAARLIFMQLMRLHFEESEFQDQSFRESMGKEFPSGRIPIEVIAWEPSAFGPDGKTRHQISSRLPRVGIEKKKVDLLVKWLQEGLDKIEQQRAEILQNPNDPDLEEKLRQLSIDETCMVGDRLAPEGRPRLYTEWFDVEKQEFHYFEPIQFQQNCTFCHWGGPKKKPMTDSLAAGNQQTNGDENAIDNANSNLTTTNLAATERPPIDHIVKIVIPTKGLQSAINKTRAILITVAIVTVFLSMFLLYLIVRYVVVKPLQHLREVADDVSRGQTEVRAELFTDDEFEELAASFNRMLRHLIDTQTKLQDANTNLDGKVDELAKANMQLYEMMQMKSEFLANMSHELRTPLNSIIGFSDVLQEIDSLSDKQKKYASNIRNSGHLLLQMINEILDLAKLEAGKMEVNPTEFSVETIVRAHLELIRPLAEDKNIKLNLVCLPKFDELYQDQTKLQQILNNLLSNAIKFTPEGGLITATIEKKFAGGIAMLQLTIEDTGVGIAKEDLDVIFEKFRQAPNKGKEGNLTREFAGTGLGLSIVKELCQLLDGKITVESEVGRGSIFTVTIPWVKKVLSKQNTQIERKLQDLTRTKYPAIAPQPSVE